MDLYITESGAEHPQLPDFIHGGVSAAGCGKSKSAIFSVFITHGSPLAQPMLFNQILHDCLDGSEHLHAG
ncbi:hypothetical protein P9D98_11800 [Bacillus mojavensis]|uniref:hypothetical protein n=1 Tax=Bacillus mojavensis TaxID=72360 RepID=UPI002DBF377F|nr:hypothetical protein [Bacillus mojavensis]MEC1635338.1 hypothetical protein [Bacillus mojavensis]